MSTGKQVSKAGNSILALPGKATSVSLQLPKSLSFEEWQNIGADIQRCEQSVMWWMGDWWNFGDHKYGDRVKVVSEDDGSSFQTWADAGWVSGAIETSRRREVLSWSHHKEVAALTPRYPDKFLAQAEAEGWSRNQLRTAVREFTRGIKGAKSLPAEGQYNVIYADPPWQYDFAQSDSRKIENQYPTMAVDDIGKLPIKAMAHEDCVLFLWATSPKVTEALQVVDDWGFEYKTCAVWDKDRIGMGYYFRQQHELLLVATCGQPGTPEPSARVSSVFRERRDDKHSKKPQSVIETIEAMYPKSKRIELFCREPRDGWSAWGNQVAT